MIEFTCTEACSVTMNLWEALELEPETWAAVIAMVIGLWAVGFLVRQIMRAMDDEGPAS